MGFAEQPFSCFGFKLRIPAEHDATKNMVLRAGSVRFSRHSNTTYLFNFSDQEILTLILAHDTCIS